MKAIKGQIIADFLAGNPMLEGEEEEESKFSDKTIMVTDTEGEWKLYFDGAANKNDYGIGILLISQEQIHLPLSLQLQFDCTNNTAEYEAFIVGLEIALEKGVTKIQLFGNSALIIH